MRAVKDILLVLLIAVIAFMTCIQEDDVKTLKTRTYYNSVNLYMVHQRLRAVESGLMVGCNPNDLLIASAMLEVEKTSTDIFGHQYKTTGYSTGVFVSSNALLAAKHAVKTRLSDASVTIVTITGKKFTVKEIIEDTDDDMVLIIINETYGPYLEMGLRPCLGENLICVGSPFRDERQLVVTWAKVTCEIWKEDGTFIYDGFCFNGCSGGPVILNGKVIGIIHARRRGTDSLGFACPVDRLDPEILTRIK